MILDSVLNIGNNILDKFFPDKAERDAAKIKLLELQQQGELKEMETSMSAIIEEAKSNDPWTSRARPTFLYVMYAMILIAVPMGILSAFNPEMSVKIADGMKAWLASIPDGLWATFGIGYTGYAIARSVDKTKIINAKK